MSQMPWTGRGETDTPLTRSARDTIMQLCDAGRYATLPGIVQLLRDYETTVRRLESGTAGLSIGAIRKRERRERNPMHSLEAIQKRVRNHWLRKSGKAQAVGG